MALQRVRSAHAWAAAALILPLAALGSGCGSAIGSDAQQILPGAPTAGTSLTLAYTGHTEEVTVPANATTVRITASGGSGGGKDGGHTRSGGHGWQLTGTLPVSPGQTLQVSVGGRGGDHHTNESPGNGGWSDDGFAGGRGGSGHGRGGQDGNGGGGATVIAVDGTPAMIAAGGGGAGGDSRPFTVEPGASGGDGGADAGSAGDRSTNTATGGRGGSIRLTDLDPQGGSAAKTELAGGGGGGGGGVAKGEGGTKSYYGGNGGGGGCSLLTSSLHRPTSTAAAPFGNGAVTLDFS